MKAVLFVLLLFSALIYVQAQKVGSLCIGQITDNGTHFVPDYKIQIDGKPTISASFHESVKVEGLAFNKNHRIKIYQSGNFQKEFTFKFREYKTSELCLWLNTPYGIWTLEADRKTNKLCNCS